MSADPFTIRPAVLDGPDSELPAILDLMREALGEALPRTEAFFRWKHLDNPAGRSLVLVAQDELGLVGLRAMMRWTFRTEDRLVRAARPVDTATHPRSRRKGLFRRLTLDALERLGDEGVQLVFNTPNDKSRPGYLKMGWRSVGRPAIWIRPGFAPWTPSLHSAPAGHHRVSDARLHTERTPEYLAWRFGPGSSLGYDVLSDGEATVRWRTRERFGGIELTLVDLDLARGGFAGCARLIRHVVGSVRCRHALAMAPLGSRQSAALALAGFVPLLGQGPTLVAREVPGVPTPARAMQLGGWRLQVGDLEVF